MKRMLLVLACVTLLPTTAAAVECSGCIMGIYDSVAMVDNFGRFDGTTKDIFLGVRFGSEAPEGLRGVEFSVSGLTPFFPVFAPEAFANIELGDIEAPVDLQDPTPPASFGLNVAWPNCQGRGDGRFVFGKVTLIALGGAGSVGDDIVLRIERRFPSTNPDEKFPLFNQCDPPIFSATSTVRGCYVINPSVGPGMTVGDCTLTDGTAVEEGTWSMVKRLYR